MTSPFVSFSSVSSESSGGFKSLLPSGSIAQRLLCVSLPLAGVHNNNSPDIWQTAAAALVVPTNQQQTKLMLKQEHHFLSPTTNFFRLEDDNCKRPLALTLPSAAKSSGVKMPVATFVIDANEELIYRGEGNSSLVVALKSVCLYPFGFLI